MKSGVSEVMVPLCVGIDHIDDLLSDLDQTLVALQMLAATMASIRPK